MRQDWPNGCGVGGARLGAGLIGVCGKNGRSEKCDFATMRFATMRDVHGCRDAMNRVSTETGVRQEWAKFYGSFFCL
jgi:hypothetical protein